MIILMFFLTIALSFAVFLVCSLKNAYTLAYDISHPRRNKYSLEKQNEVSYQKFCFQSVDGKTLYGIDVMPKGGVTGTLLLCHNLGGSKELAVSYFGFLLKENFRLISFDFRNHGESDTTHSIIFNFNKDFEAFYSEIKKRNISGPLGIVGLSIGSNVALHAIYKHPEIRCILIDSGPLLFSKNYFLYVLNFNKVKNLFTRSFFLLLFLYYGGFSGLAASTAKILTALKGKPFFLICAENDHIITERNITQAYAYAESADSHIWMVPKSRHLTNYFIEKNLYMEKVKQFFLHYFK